MEKSSIKSPEERSNGHNQDSIGIHQGFLPLWFIQDINSFKCFFLWCFLNNLKNKVPERSLLLLTHLCCVAHSW